jgi:hypothetical protein
MVNNLQKEHAMSACRTNTDIFMRTPSYATPNPSVWNESLTIAVEAAVGNVDARALSPPEGRKRFSPLDAKRLLALLSWSYARELYSSAEIHTRLRRGQTSELWDGGVPDVAEISHFRMENRKALQSCLQAALRFLAAKKVAEGIIARINDAHIAAEAARRIIAAIFVDNTEATALATL